MLGIFKDIFAYLSNLNSPYSTDDSGKDKSCLDPDDHVLTETSSQTLRDYLNSKYVAADPLEGLNEVLKYRSDGPLSKFLGTDESAGITSEVTDIIKPKLIAKGKMRDIDDFEVMPNGKIRIYTWEERVKDSEARRPSRRGPLF